MRNLIILFLLVCFYSKAQSWEWKTRFGNTSTDIGSSIAVDKSGFIYSVGYYADSIKFGNFKLDSTSSYILKQRPDGGVVWAKSMNGAFAEQITIDTLDNIYIAGQFWANALIGNQIIVSDSNNTSFFVAKLDTSGAAIWINGDIIINSGSILDLDVDDDFNLGITGYFNAFMVVGQDTIYSCSKDAFVAKYSYTGSLSWYKSIRTCSKDFGNGIALDSQGNIYFTGYAGGNQDTVRLDSFYLPSSNLYFISKISPLGDVLWFSGDSLCIGYDVAINKSDDIFVAGGFSGTVIFGNDTINSQCLSSFINKMDTNGNIIWSKQSFCSDNQSASIPKKIECDINNGFFTLINFIGDHIFDTIQVSSQSASSCLQHYDDFGNIVFLKRIISATQDLSDLAIGSDNSSHVIGTFSTASSNDYILFDNDSIFSTGGYDIIIAKLNGHEVSIKEVPELAEKVIIYPNPNHDFFLVNNFSSANGIISILDQFGRILFETNLNKGVNRMNTSDLPEGVLIIRIITDEGMIVKKMIHN